MPSADVRPLTAAAAFLLALCASGAARAQEEVDPRAPQPKAPLELAAPAAPDPMLSGEDLREAPGPLLRELAFEAYQEGDLDMAARLQHFAVAADGEGQYNLACFHALGGDADAAFYWLQRAAQEELSDPDWAAEDSDLDLLHEDPRWAEVHGYLEAMHTWWRASGRSETLLVVPAGVDPGAPVPALVGLHGRGSSPRDFADAEAYQALADDLGVAFVGVSGTIPVGPRGFEWSGDPARDAERVAAALAEVADDVTIDRNAVVLIGFSQGGQAAAEVAARHPDRYAGAIVMSPGAMQGCQLGAVEADLAESRFVVLWGAGEHPVTVALAEQDTDVLRERGARVYSHGYPDVDEHRFPPDYEERLGEWLDFVRGEAELEGDF